MVGEIAEVIGDKSDRTRDLLSSVALTTILFAVGASDVTPWQLS
jgi:hypothetical protein